jgi:hypothetical protein
MKKGKENNTKESRETEEERETGTGKDVLKFDDRILVCQRLD